MNSGRFHYLGPITHARKKFVAMFFCGLLLIVLACVTFQRLREYVLLENLPQIYELDFKSQPYISAAIYLQSIGREAAIQHMMAVARRAEAKDDRAEQIYVLCRMLFTNRGTNDFREPYIGKFTLYGGTVSTDWPLVPIEIVDGVPFDVAASYACYASPERPRDYLKYCMDDCDWNTFKFKTKSRDELKTALKKLLASPKWKLPLDSYETDFFAQQIENKKKKVHVYSQ